LAQEYCQLQHVNHGKITIADDSGYWVDEVQIILYRHTLAIHHAKLEAGGTASTEFSTKEYPSVLTLYTRRRRFATTDGRLSKLLRSGFLLSVLS
jgi:hypothetical protein